MVKQGQRKVGAVSRKMLVAGMMGLSGLSAHVAVSDYLNPPFAWDPDKTKNLPTNEPRVRAKLPTYMTRFPYPNVQNININEEHIWPEALRKYKANKLHYYKASGRTPPFTSY